MDFFSRNLTELAKQGTLGSFHGREKVLQQAVTVLAQDGKSNVIFTGEPGVGKTAVVEALAQKIATGDAPDSLRNASIQELDVNALTAGTPGASRAHACGWSLADRPPWPVECGL